jgi:uncharacterized repeat protein (TIGR01451 family)
LVASPTNVGDDEATDSDGTPSADGTTATTDVITLGSRQVDLTVDQGLSEKPAGGVDLEITKTVNQPETRTGPVEWRIVVTNLGPETAKGPITMTDVLPKELTVLSYDTDSLWDCELNTAGNGCGLGDELVKGMADHVLWIPEAPWMLSPILTVLPLQLLAYHIAAIRGLDVDQPRNLAKSVTVE